MGLFSFVGKAIKGVAKIAGGAARVAGGLGIIPGGGLIGKAAGILLQQKQPMSGTATKISLRSPVMMRGKTASSFRRTEFPGAAVLRSSPVMPGGSIATARGIVPASGGPAPVSYAGGSPTAPKKRRKTAKRRKTTTRKRRKSRLKFGSPAWRKKYLGHGRKKRRRAA